ncbi:hypothetical protein SDC9_101513 [bioreactor metagenome]|uniref:Uncharacterized protein n=1 Tax=bioreactor metagenome TaxID=1076179 RepID=A0A645AV05_9ZZZZ
METHKIPLFPLHDVHGLCRKVQYLLQHPQHPSAVRLPHLQADKIGDKVSSGGQVNVLPADVNHLALEAHGGVDLVHALQGEDEVSFVHSGRAHLDGTAVHIQGGEVQQELGGVAPRLQLYLALDAVSVNDAAGLQQFIFHPYLSLRKTAG